MFGFFRIFKIKLAVYGTRALFGFTDVEFWRSVKYT